MLFAILFTIVLYVALGFLLAWIINMVAQEEAGVGTGVVILLCVFAIDLVMDIFLPVEGTLAPVLGIVVHLAVLTGMIHLVAKVSLKHSAIIAAIFSAVLFAIRLGIGLIAVTAGA